MNVLTSKPATKNIRTLETMSQISPHKGTLSVILRTYKAAVTTLCRARGFTRFAWHSRFYDHIIRDGADLDRIRRYIIDNPKNWTNDENFPGNIRMDRMHDRPEDWSALDQHVNRSSAGIEKNLTSIRTLKGKKNSLFSRSLLPKSN